MTSLKEFIERFAAADEVTLGKTNASECALAIGAPKGVRLIGCDGFPCRRGRQLFFRKISTGWHLSARKQSGAAPRSIPRRRPGRCASSLRYPAAGSFCERQMTLSTPAGTSLSARLLPSLLSVIAGTTDVISFLGLGGLFTAHITGNLVILAAPRRHEWHRALWRDPVGSRIYGGARLTRLLATGLNTIGVASLRPLLLPASLSLVSPWARTPIRMRQRQSSPACSAFGDGRSERPRAGRAQRSAGYRGDDEPTSRGSRWMSARCC